MHLLGSLASARNFQEEVSHGMLCSITRWGLVGEFAFLSRPFFFRGTLTLCSLKLLWVAPR